MDLFPSSSRKMGSHLLTWIYFLGWDQREFFGTYPIFAKEYEYVLGFEVLTAVVIKSSIFWDITPCSLLKVNRRFGGIYRLHLQDRRLRWQAEWLCWFLAQLILRLRRWR
jgi:hypothetical protein